MNTAVICIGNSDDKLTQREWSGFVSDVQRFVDRWRFTIYFHGCAASSAPWQNACWVLDARDLFGEPGGMAIDILREELGRLAKMYKQDSIALILGDSEMVTPKDRKLETSNEVPCTRKLSHEPHLWGESNKRRCPGLSNG